jgi:hypothetical protein
MARRGMDNIRRQLTGGSAVIEVDRTASPAAPAL